MCIRDRDRLWVVGSNNDTAEFIDNSYKKILNILEEHFKEQPFLLGNFPSSCDFAVYGQFTQLVGFDPTPRRIAHEISPRTVAWVSTLEDRGGLSYSEENKSLDSLSDSIHDLFKELATSYIPTMIENHKAINEGEKEWSVDLAGYPWKQKSFPYQAKCLDWIRDEFKKLDTENQEKVLNFLTATNCQSLVE